MDQRSIFAECVVRRYEQGYNSREVIERCAEEIESLLADEETGRPESD